MNSENLYKSPAEAPETRDELGAKSRRRPTFCSALLWFVGLLFLLTLNGQAFTNALAFMGAGAASMCLWIRWYRPLPPGKERREGVLIILGHTAVIIAMGAMLPNAYRQQSRFNDRTRRPQKETRQTPAYAPATVEIEKSLKPNASDFVCLPRQTASTS